MCESQKVREIREEGQEGSGKEWKEDIFGLHGEEERQI